MIRISQLIEQLEKYKAKRGDVVVLTIEHGCGGHAVSFSGGLCDTTNHNEHNILPSEFHEGGEDGRWTDKQIKEIFPAWDGDHDTLCKLPPIPAVLLDVDGQIYCT